MNEAQSAAPEKAIAEPYVAYKTFKGFLDGLKVSIPSRIDRSVMSTYSGAVQQQLLHALKFFDLIGANGHPKAALQDLVHAEGPKRQEVLKAMIVRSYPKLFGGEFDLQKGTSGQLAEQFTANGDTARKSIAFLLPLLKEAGISISPHIKGPPKRGGNGAGKRRRAAPVIEQANPPLPPPPPAAQGWAEMLLSKFPSFDPTWPDDVKKQWFEGFDKLMASNSKPQGGGA